jgi:hypothetical protein
MTYLCSEPQTKHIGVLRMQVGTIRPRTVSLISKLIRPLIHEGIITVNEGIEITANLRHLATKGTLLPPLPPKLLTQSEAADMLNIGLSNFKKMERDDAFPFSRKMVGSSVRFLNLDVLRFIMDEDVN